LPIGSIPVPDDTSKQSRHQTFQQPKGTRFAVAGGGGDERATRERGKGGVTVEERGSPESGGGGGQR
jgi:hypothetical protein